MLGGFIEIRFKGMFLNVLEYVCCLLVATVLAKRNSQGFMNILVVQIETGLLGSRFLTLMRKTHF